MVYGKSIPLVSQTEEHTQVQREGPQRERGRNKKANKQTKRLTAKRLASNVEPWYLSLGRERNETQKNWVLG